MKVKRECKLCGKKIEIWFCKIKAGKGLFCSQKCFKEWYSKNCSGKNSPYWRGRTKRECLICGKIFYPRLAPSIIRKKKSKFCSHKCADVWRSRNRRGENSPAWKGGVSPINTRIRGSIEYRLWRESVFARDNWTCQKCSERGGSLNAHHIKPFIKYPELRTSIENGITLCKKCHQKINRREGN